MTALNGWENFYVIVGSSAGALIGLQFVVITLIADMRLAPGTALAGSAFTTPSVVHFGAVLFLSAVVTVPWNGITALAVLWGAAGFFGIVYSLLIARRLRRQTIYKPVFEDWLFHLLLPLVAYIMLSTAPLTTASDKRTALFLVGAAALVLLFVGIHNAWDTVTYHVFSKKNETQNGELHG